LPNYCESFTSSKNDINIYFYLPNNRCQWEIVQDRFRPNQPQPPQPQNQVESSSEKEDDSVSQSDSNSISESSNLHITQQQNQNPVASLKKTGLPYFSVGKGRKKETIRVRCKYSGDKEVSCQMKTLKESDLLSIVQNPFSSSEMDHIVGNIKKSLHEKGYVTQLKDTEFKEKVQSAFQKYLENV
jgi:hypothetical protein